MKLMSTKNWGWVGIGTLLYVAGINLFMVPHGFYTGGLMGVSQLIRTLVIDIFQIPFGSFDFAGIILYLFNIPIYILAYRNIGKRFFFSSLICTTLMTILFSLVPIPASPLFGEDALASCIIGGYLAGYGVGLILRAGTSAGGSEMVGLMVIRKKKDFSIGRFNLGINLVVYLCCLFFFDIKVVLYSIIAAVASSLAIDKIHTQNIDVEVRVITKNFDKAMKDEIMGTMGRGITVMPAEGAYTGKKAEVLYILVSKYEVNQLHHIVSRYDPEAFFVVNERVQIYGNYTKKLDA